MLPQPELPIEYQIDSIRDEVSQLHDLFTRRLMEDKAKTQLMSCLNSQTRAVRDVAFRRGLESMILEILVAIDRLQKQGNSRENFVSVAEELEEVLARRSLPVDDDPSVGGHISTDDNE